MNEQDPSKRCLAVGHMKIKNNKVFGNNTNTSGCSRL